MSARKLSEDDVIQIRVEYEMGITTMKALAKYWSITEACISNILNEKTYKDIAEYEYV